MPPQGTPAEPGHALRVWNRWVEGPSQLHAEQAWFEQGKLCGMQYLLNTAGSAKE